jgi:hypothetical protein
MSEQAIGLIGKRSVSQARRMLAKVVEKPHSIGESIARKHTIWPSEAQRLRTCFNKAAKVGRCTDVCLVLSGSTSEGVLDDDCEKLVVNGPDRAHPGCFLGCAQAINSAAVFNLTQDRSMVSIALLARIEAHSSA